MKKWLAATWLASMGIMALEIFSGLPAEQQRAVGIIVGGAIAILITIYSIVILMTHEENP